MRVLCSRHGSVVLPDGTAMVRRGSSRGKWMSKSSTGCVESCVSMTRCFYKYQMDGARSVDAKEVS